MVTFQNLCYDPLTKRPQLRAFPKTNYNKNVLANQCFVAPHADYVHVLLLVGAF